MYRAKTHQKFRIANWNQNGLIAMNLLVVRFDLTLRYNSDLDSPMS